MALQKAGALWKKNKDGKTFLSGEIEIRGVKTKMVVYMNDYKKEPKHPDYVLYVIDDEELHPSAPRKTCATCGKEFNPNPKAQWAKDCLECWKRTQTPNNAQNASTGQNQQPAEAFVPPLPPQEPAPQQNNPVVDGYGNSEINVEDIPF